MRMEDAIQFGLSISDRVVLDVVDEMSDASTTFPMPKGGCHPQRTLWVAWYPSQRGKWRRRTGRRHPTPEGCRLSTSASTGCSKPR